MNELDRMYEALEKADAAGNTSDAREIAGYIRAYQPTPEPTPPTPPKPNEYAEEYQAESSLGAFGLGAERALEQTGEGLMDLWYRAGGDYGNNKDNLAALTETSRLKDEAFSASKKEYPVATTAGAITSDIAQFALPVAGMAGKVGKLSSTGRLAFAAGEGAAIEGITNSGDLTTRMDNAQSGALWGMLGQKGGELLGAGYRAIRGKMSPPNGVSRLQTAEDSLAKSRIDRAKNDGGFMLDQADARANPEGLADARAATSSPDSNDYQQFKAQQEIDISNKAEQLVDNVSGSTTRFENSAAREMLADAMTRVRKEEFGAGSANYNSWLEAEGRDIPLNSSGLTGEVNAVLDDLKPSANSTVKKVKSVLDKYGFFPKTEEVTDTLLNSSGTASTLTKNVEAQKPLTAGNYEEMVQEINDLFTQGASKAENKPITQIFELLKEKQPDILGATDGIPPEAMKLGEIARNEWRRLSTEWSVNDVVDKMTSKNKYGEAKIQPFAAAQKLLHPDNVKQLQRIKSKLTLGKNTENHRAWFAMSQAPILEALESSYKNTGRVTAGGGQIFDVKAFAAKINKLDPATRRTLWGEEAEASIQKAIKAWQLKDKKSNGRGINMGGSEALAASGASLLIRMLAPAGRAGSAVFASLPVVRELIQGVKSNRITKEGNNLAAGKETTAMLASKEAALKEELKTLFGRENYQKFSGAIELISRTYARNDE
jgi:hypothetical protein